MELSFDDADLAETCSCRELMLGRWGDDGFASVAVRLKQLAAAADASEVEMLPDCELEHRGGSKVTISFGGSDLVIRGALDGRPAARDEHARLQISEIDRRDATVAR
jgi:hypothetical protein